MRSGRFPRRGGVQPRWSHDRAEIFYVGLDGRLMAVPISETPDGAAIDRGTPVALNAPPVPLLFDGGTALPVLRGLEEWPAVPDVRISAPAALVACHAALQLTIGAVALLR
jgi:hypothetical protein